MEPPGPGLICPGLEEGEDESDWGLPEAVAGSRLRLP